MRTLDVDEARERLSELIGRAHAGEDIVITAKDGTAVGLMPVPPHGEPRFGSARGLFTLSDDFDSALPEFAPYER